LNLSAKDAIQNCKILKSTLETAYEITKLVKFSPRRQSIFKGINVSLKIIKSFKSCGNKLQDVAKDTETVTRIQRVASQIKTFEFFFGLVFDEMLL